MKNKVLAIAAIALSALLLTSCASRKYGCPNTAGMKVEAKAPSLHA